MPTGYTADIKDGESFEDFAMHCARGMGACVMMRDEPAGTPIPEKFEPSSYHTKALKAAEKALSSLKVLTPEQQEANSTGVFNKAMAENEKRIRESMDLREKYNHMLSLVEAWDPPSEDHAYFKDFMADQIETSIEFDCNDGYYLNNKPQLLSGTEWAAQETERALKDIVYHTEEHRKEIKRVAARNKWLKDLRDSLK